MCAWSWACPGVEGGTGAPKPSAQLSLDRNRAGLYTGFFSVFVPVSCVCV